MSIQVGDIFPSVDVHVMINGAPRKVSTDDLVAGKKVVLFALPGAFTPTCSAAHLPGYVIHADEIKSKGIDSICCLSVNDSFVMDAWAKDHNVEDRITMLADGNGDLTRALGLEMDGRGFGMGIRSQRYAMILENGTVTALYVEKPKAFEASSAEAILKAL